MHRWQFAPLAHDRSESFESVERRDQGGNTDERTSNNLHAATYDLGQTVSLD
jgi:hypothetical protein